MLDVGFSELLLIAIVALVVIGPKDLPVVFKHVARVLRDMQGIYAGLKKQMHDLVDEAGLDDLHKNVTTIIDLEGKPQKAFDVSELEGLRDVPPPVGGRLGGGHGEAPSSNSPPPHPSPDEGGSTQVPPLAPAMRGKDE